MVWWCCGVVVWWCGGVLVVVLDGVFDVVCPIRPRDTPNSGGHDQPRPVPMHRAPKSLPRTSAVKALNTGCMFTGTTPELHLRHLPTVDDKREHSAYSIHTSKTSHELCRCKTVLLIHTHNTKEENTTRMASSLANQPRICHGCRRRARPQHRTCIHCQAKRCERRVSCITTGMPTPLSKQQAAQLALCVPVSVAKQRP